MGEFGEPRYGKGDAVVLRSSLEIGRVLADPDLDAGEYWYRVQFQKRIDNVVEEDLDTLDDTHESIESLVLAGRWGELRAFRRALAVERILNTNRSTVYSFNAQRILFEPYQYKPLLKILDAHDRRILIADEVGLGKTIEAGLVLTELEARQPLEKVLVVCPSRLRDKWREELNRKFDQDFEVYDRRALLEYLGRLRDNPSRGRLRAIVSMQTLRSEDLRDELTAGVGTLDVVIVDEAHHARNPLTLTTAMLVELGQACEAMLLLTATPLHLGSRDLFTLLNALRPSEFSNPRAFEDELERHRDVIGAARLVRARNPEYLPVARVLLQQVELGRGPLLPPDPLADQVIAELGGAPPADGRAWVELERRIQDIHPLSTLVTRTRKKDVAENAPERRAHVFACEWTEEEHRAYIALVGSAKRGGWLRPGAGLGAVQRARQAASCLPAAIAARAERIERDADGSGEAHDLLFELFDDTSPDNPESAADLAVPATDSKFEKLREILDMIWEEEPDSKVLIFTFFVGTSEYLERRIEELGHQALRISGNVPSNPHDPARDERGRRMRRFREDPRIRVLVSTEVGSEGLDFQFCHHVVNYDLPWNPMVVEQRIGRIDRFGQESPVVVVHNLVVTGTVEDRILYRLYERIGIFKQSIGDIEAILGETIHDLQRDYVTGRLTPEEAERRVEAAARAIENQRLHLEELEKKAGDLFGHEEYILGEMERVRRLGRYLSENALLSVIDGYLRHQHPGSRLFSPSPDVHAFRLTPELRTAIVTAATDGPPWMDSSRDGFLHFTTKGEVAFRQPGLDLVNVSHPLVRAAAAALEKMLSEPTARVGKCSLDLPRADTTTLGPGTYLVVVFAQHVEGLRARRLLEAVAWHRESGTLVDAETGEELLHRLIEDGVEWAGAGAAPSVPEKAWRGVVSEIRRRNRLLLETERTENEARYVRRRRALDGEHRYKIGAIRTKLDTARQRNRGEHILGLFQRQIDIAEAKYQTRVQELDRDRQVHARVEDPLAACLVHVRRFDAAEE